MNDQKISEQIKDDSKDLVTIDYYDRIHKQWIKVEVTKEVARFMQSDKKKTRRKQNQYDFYNIPLSSFETEEDDYCFDIEDENSDIEKKYDEKIKQDLQDIKEDYERTIIENSLYILTPEQREVVEMVFYQNMTYREIAKVLNISKQSVCERLKNAKRKIKNHIKNG